MHWSGMEEWTRTKKVNTRTLRKKEKRFEYMYSVRCTLERNLLCSAEESRIHVPTPSAWLFEVVCISPGLSGMCVCAFGSRFQAKRVERVFSNEKRVTQVQGWGGGELLAIKVLCNREGMQKRFFAKNDFLPKYKKKFVSHGKDWEEKMQNKCSAFCVHHCKPHATLVWLRARTFCAAVVIHFLWAAAKVRIQPDPGGERGRNAIVKTQFRLQKNFPPLSTWTHSQTNANERTKDRQRKGPTC